MSIKIYRSGSTHIEAGIECEIKLIEPHDLDFNISIGYVKTPEELSKPAVKQVQSEFENLSPEDIRDLAKDSGIEGWDIKRIGTLKAELSDDNSAQG